MTFEKAIANYRSCATTHLELREAEREAGRMLAQGDAKLWASEAVQEGTNDKQRKALFEAACAVDELREEQSEAVDSIGFSAALAEIEETCALLEAEYQRNIAVPEPLITLDHDRTTEGN